MDLGSLNIFKYVIPFVIVLTLSFAGSLINRDGRFSTSTFLFGLNVGLLLLVFINYYPSYIIIFNVALLTAMLFGGING